MKAKRWTSWRLAPAFTIAISVGIIATASAPAGAASAAAGAVGASTSPASTDTCTFYNANLGNWIAIDNNSVRADAWTVSGSYVYLERYTDSLSQCWKVIGGFGNGEHELENAYDGQCLRVSNTAPKSPNDLVDMSACLSQTFEKFVDGAPAADGLSYTALEDENLSVAAQGSVSPGVALVLATDNWTHPGMLWYNNTNP
jgi:hypothetical protein